MQAGLFDSHPRQEAIAGLVFEQEFVSAEEERALIGLIATLPLEAARYKQYTARRKVVSFGGSYDFDAQTLESADVLDARLEPLRARVAEWLKVREDELAHALVAEYAPGTPLGWHRDVPDFETICGVSLGSAARLRFRPYPHVAGAPSSPPLTMVAEPRSIYKISGPARWQWQHAVSPVDAMRWSITFRTRAARRLG